MLKYNLDADHIFTREPRDDGKYSIVNKDGSLSPYYDNKYFYMRRRGNNIRMLYYGKSKEKCLSIFKENLIEGHTITDNVGILSDK